MTALKEFLDSFKIEYLKDEPMSRHTSFRIGGNADIFILPHNIKQLEKTVDYCRKENIPFEIVGKGSNLLVSDKGIEGAVICTLSINDITEKDGVVTAFSGASLASLCTFARDKSLSGLEFAYGIPGSVGGAMIMNAGAYGGEMKDVATKARVIDSSGEIRTIKGDEMELSYRNSVFKKKNLIVLEASFKLKNDNKEAISERMEDFLNRRKTKQPLEYPSGGSVFKRPEGYFAGVLIEQNGLKGLTQGGAMVSEKHAGFIVNKGNATCSDVKTLIVKIQEKVMKNSGVQLETELIFKGRQ